MSVVLKSAKFFLPVLICLGLATQLHAESAPNAPREHNVRLGGEEATPSRLAAKRLLLASAKAGKRLVAAGEFGHIVYSDDGGKNWTQAASVPTQVTLTSLYFIDEKRGFAGGHDSTVLRTEDGGDHWTLSYHDEASQMPVLSLYFENAEHGFAVGAFSLVIETKDGGKSWSKRSLLAGKQEDAHLNAIFADRKGLIYIAAEFGEVYRSADHGASFTQARTGSESSFWGGLPLSDGSVLVFGMGGNVYRSSGIFGWNKVNSGTGQPIQAGTQLQNGPVVLVGLQGYVGFSRDGGANFTAVTEDNRLGIASVMEASPGELAIFGESGASLIPNNAEDAIKTAGFSPVMAKARKD